MSRPDLQAAVHATDIAEEAGEKMLGLGFAVNRLTRRALVACGVDENTAKWVGRGVGWTTSLISLDASGFFDIPDVPDVPDSDS
jgi:hypothetical protein